MPTAAEVQEALAGVLSRPEFQERQSIGLLAWLARQRDELLAALWSLLERLNLLDLGGSALLLGLRVLLVLTAGFLVVHLVLSLAGRRRGRPVREAPLTAGTAASAAVDWTAAAERAAAAGRFRDAVLALYQALLQRLQGRGVLRYDPAKTPGDYRRELRAHPDPARGLDRFLRHFEPVAFGGREPDRRTFDRLRQLARETAGE